MNTYKIFKHPAVSGIKVGSYIIENQVTMRSNWVRSSKKALRILEGDQPTSWDLAVVARKDEISGSEIMSRHANAEVITEQELRMNILLGMYDFPA